MYVRQPSKSIKIPENYNGNAFSPQAISREMPPPLRQSMQGHPLGDLPPNERIRGGEALSDESSFDDDINSSATSENIFPENKPYKDNDPNNTFSGGQPLEIDSEPPIPPHTPTLSQRATIPTGTRDNTKSESVGNSLFQTLLPPVGRLEEHFPFGHGIGSEELLIMAMMLLVYLSGEEDQKPDNELLLLLGLLLFAG